MQAGLEGMSERKSDIWSFLSPVGLVATSNRLIAATSAAVCQSSYHFSIKSLICNWAENKESQTQIGPAAHSYTSDLLIIWTYFSQENRFSLIHNIFVSKLNFSK